MELAHFRGDRAYTEHRDQIRNTSLGSCMREVPTIECIATKGKVCELGEMADLCRNASYNMMYAAAKQEAGGSGVGGLMNLAR